MQTWAWSLHEKLSCHLPLDSQHLPRKAVHQVLATQATHGQRSWKCIELCTRSCEQHACSTLQVS